MKRALEQAPREVTDGGTLVLSNALGTSSELWAPQLPVLSERFRVVTYEHPPLASVEALAADLLETLDRLGVGAFSFCGLSLGAMVGMQVAVEAPARLERLVLACTSARFGEPGEWAERAALVRREGMQAVAHDALDKWFTPAYREREPFLRMQLETPREAYARGLEAIGGFDFREHLGEIAAPTLVIAGAEDEATPAIDAAFIAKRIPGARLLMLAGAAHLANVERAEEFTAAVLEHLAGEPGPRIDPATSRSSATRG